MDENTHKPSRKSGKKASSKTVNTTNVASTTTKVNAKGSSGETTSTATSTTNTKPPADKNKPSSSKVIAPLVNTGNPKPSSKPNSGTGSNTTSTDRSSTANAKLPADKKKKSSTNIVVPIVNTVNPKSSTKTSSTTSGTVTSKTTSITTTKPKRQQSGSTGGSAGGSAGSSTGGNEEKKEKHKPRQETKNTANQVRNEERNSAGVKPSTSSELDANSAKTGVRMRLYVFRGSPDVYYRRHVIMEVETPDFYEHIHIQRPSDKHPWHIERSPEWTDWLMSHKYVSHFHAGITVVPKGWEPKILDAFEAVPVVNREGDWNCQKFILEGMEGLVKKGYQTQAWYDAIESELLDHLFQNALEA